VRRRELFEPKNVTESRPEPPFILREPQDERRAEGGDTGILAVTFYLSLLFSEKVPYRNTVFFLTKYKFHLIFSGADL